MVGLHVVTAEMHHIGLPRPRAKRAQGHGQKFFSGQPGLAFQHPARLCVVRAEFAMQAEIGLLHVPQPEHKARALAPQFIHVQHNGQPFHPRAKFGLAEGERLDRSIMFVRLSERLQPRIIKKETHPHRGMHEP